MKSVSANPNISEILTSLDWLIFALVLLLTLGAVFFGHWKKSQLRLEEEAKSSEGILDLILMGRRLTLPLFVGTLVATWYGGIFGVTQLAFEKGIYNFLTQGVFWYFSYIIFALFLVSRIRQFKAVTLPELVSKMFGPRSGKLAAIFNFFNVLPITYVMSLGYFLMLLFGGGLVENMLIGTLVVLLYSVLGGFRAVVFSDFIQFFVMCMSVFLIFIFSVSQFGGYDFLVKKLPSDHFSLLGGESIWTALVWGLIAISTLVDPNFYQRVFAAKSSKVAKRGILISTLVWIAFDICTTAGALYARAIIPEAESGTAYLAYALQIVPNGFRGFLMAGILATILSTLDSYIFIAGTTLSYDLAPKKFKLNTQWNHLGVLCSGLLAVFVASFFEGNIRAVWKTMGSYSAACLLCPVLVGFLFPGRISDRNFVISSLAGVVTVSVWRNVELPSHLAVFDEIYIGFLTTALFLMFFLWRRTWRI